MKEALRATMRRHLAALSPDEREQRSRRVWWQIVESQEWRAAARVLLFAPLPGEPNLNLLWQTGDLTGKQVVYPRVDGLKLRLYTVDSPGDLEPTRWGLREPLARAGCEVTLGDIDLALVPGMAFDHAGGRLGRGGGFYDRLLANRNPAKTRLIGVGFSFQRIEGTLPWAAHDVRLDEICTD